MTITSVYIALLVYLIPILLPVVHVASSNIDVFVDNSILACVLAASTAVDCSLDLLVNAHMMSIRRERKYVTKIFEELGPCNVRRNYRMTADTFWKLHRLLQPNIPCSKRRKRKRGSTRNGDISSSLKLSMAIRYFAAGSPADILSSHVVGMTDVYIKIIFEARSYISVKR